MKVLLYQCDQNDNGILRESFAQREDIVLSVCTTYEACAAYCSENDADMCFLTLNAPAEQLEEVRNLIRQQETQPLLCLIGTRKEAANYAFKYNCDRLLISPYREKESRECIEEMCMLRSQPVHVTIRTFGSFDVMVNGRSVIFHNAKAKELLALCVDKAGGIVTSKNAIDKLWPDRLFDQCTERLYRKAVSAIVQTLRVNGISYIFCHFRGGCMANLRGVKCDYLSFLAAPEENLHLPYEMYLPQYDWAEESIGRLTRVAEYAKEKHARSASGA